MQIPKSKKIAVFDIDGTLYRGNLTWDFFHDLIKSGLISSSVMKELESFYIAHDTREHDDAYRDFDMHLIEQFIVNIRQITDMERYWDVGQQVGTKNAARLYRFTRDLFVNLKANDYTTIAITNAVGAVAKPFAHRVGFDIVLSNDELINARTKQVRSWAIIENHLEKGTLLENLVQTNGFEYQDSYGIGDTAADISILEKVANPIAFNPEKQLKTMAIERGWALVLERKNSIYHLRPNGKDLVLDQSSEDTF